MYLEIKDDLIFIVLTSEYLEKIKKDKYKVGKESCVCPLHDDRLSITIQYCPKEVTFCPKQLIYGTDLRSFGSHRSQDEDHDKGY